MKRITKISLTIVGLLAFAGLIYAVTPSQNSSATVTAISNPVANAAGNSMAPLVAPPPVYFNQIIGPQGSGPIGVAAAPSLLVVTEFCAAPDGTIALDSIPASGGLLHSLYALVPFLPNTCAAVYLGLSPH